MLALSLIGHRGCGGFIQHFAEAVGGNKMLIMPTRFIFPGLVHEDLAVRVGRQRGATARNIQPGVHAHVVEVGPLVFREGVIPRCANDLPRLERHPPSGESLLDDILTVRVGDNTTMLVSRQRIAFGLAEQLARIVVDGGRGGRN